MGAILESAATGELILLFAEDIANEIRQTIANRHDLSKRITVTRVDALIALLEDVGEPLPPLDYPLPPIGRDPKDAFLIAHAVVAEADYLVSWDRDLLDLREIAEVKIVSPPELLAALRDHDVETP